MKGVCNEGYTDGYKKQVYQEGYPGLKEKPKKKPEKEEE